MANFTDAQNRTWKVFIDIPTVKLLRDSGLDLLKLFDNDFALMDQVIGDPVKLVDTLWLVCRDEIAERGMDETGFAKALYGDALMNAAAALVEGVCDFFPDPKRREALKTVFRMTKEAEGMMADRALRLLGEVSVETISAEMEKFYTEKSAASQAS